MSNKKSQITYLKSSSGTHYVYFPYEVPNSKDCNKLQIPMFVFRLKEFTTAFEIGEKQCGRKPLCWLSPDITLNRLHDVLKERGLRGYLDSKHSPENKMNALVDEWKRKNLVSDSEPSQLGQLETSSLSRQPAMPQHKSTTPQPPALKQSASMAKSARKPRRGPFLDDSDTDTGPTIPKPRAQQQSASTAKPTKESRNPFLSDSDTSEKGSTILKSQAQQRPRASMASKQPSTFKPLGVELLNPVIIEDSVDSDTYENEYKNSMFVTQASEEPRKKRAFDKMKAARKRRQQEANANNNPSFKSNIFIFPLQPERAEELGKGKGKEKEPPAQPKDAKKPSSSRNSKNKDSNTTERASREPKPRSNKGRREHRSGSSDSARPEPGRRQSPGREPTKPKKAHRRVINTDSSSDPDPRPKKRRDKDGTEPKKHRPKSSSSIGPDSERSQSQTTNANQAMRRPHQRPRSSQHSNRLVPETFYRGIHGDYDVKPVNPDGDERTELERSYDPLDFLPKGY